MIRMHLGRLIADRRLNQKELAGLTGIRQATISALVNDMAISVKFEQLDLLCEALDCQLHELIEYVPNTTKIAGTKYVIRNKRKNR